MFIFIGVDRSAGSNHHSLVFSRFDSMNNRELAAATNVQPLNLLLLLTGVVLEYLGAECRVPLRITGIVRGLRDQPPLRR